MFQNPGVPLQQDTNFIFEISSMFRKMMLWSGLGKDETR